MASIDVKKVMENSEKAAALRAKLDRENALFAQLSLDLDSSVDGNDTLGSSFDSTGLADLPTSFAHLKAAKNLLCNKEAIRQDKATVSGKYKRLHLMCSTAEHRAASCPEDLELLKDAKCTRMNFVDLALLDATKLSSNNIWQVAEQNVIAGSGQQKGPTIDMCLAWLSHAAQCPIASLVPSGEIYPEADKYLETRLVHKTLPVLVDGQREAVASAQMCHVLSLLSVCDLCKLDASDLSILMFVLCRLGIDEKSGPWLDSKLTTVCQKIMVSAEEKQRQLIVQFSRIFPLIEDDVRSLRVVFELLRLANLPMSLLISLASALFIHLSERAECEPDNVETSPEEQFIDAHLEAVLETFGNLLELYEEERDKQSAILFILDASLHPHLMMASYATRWRLVAGVLEPWERQLARSGSMDDSILIQQVRSTLGRLGSYKKIGE